MLKRLGCQKVYNLWYNDTPLFHRNINLDAFYIFEIKGKYKPLLAKFDCAKDSSDARFTVVQNIDKKIQNP